MPKGHAGFVEMTEFFPVINSLRPKILKTAGFCRGALMNLTQRQEAATGLLFILPAFLVIAVFQIFPMFYALDLSFFKWDMITKKTFAACATTRTSSPNPRSGNPWVDILLRGCLNTFGLGLSLLFAVLLDKGSKAWIFRTAFSFLTSPPLPRSPWCGCGSIIPIPLAC